MTIERTEDYAVIHAIMSAPSVYEWISDDGSAPREEWRPAESDKIWYLLVRDDKELLGLWMLVPRNAIEYEVHTCLLPGHGFRRARQAAKEAIDWVWRNVPRCWRLITAVPAFNRVAYQFALDSGFEPIGVDRRSFMKQGKLYDQALLGLSRE